MTTTTTLTSDLRVYRLQIMNLLTSMTVKYSPLATLSNSSLEIQGYTIDENNPQTWKYYLNMIGEYHESDTMMTITSLDTRTTIDFTVDNLTQHPRTRTAYIPGSTYYANLCTRYPTQVDLIKNIVYPVSDIDTAIDADDYTLLAYGTGFLEDTESGYIIQEIEKALAYMGYRWNLGYLSYEPYYHITNWGQIWHRLTEAAFSARFKAIRTINVHSWHIWEYIQSNGLGDYSDILSREQCMFLYRDLQYIIQNRGKESNLVILANNILSGLSVGLFGRDVYQQTQDGASDYQLIPELVAVNIPTDLDLQDESVPASSIADMNARLIEVGDEVDSETEYVTSVERTLSATTLNTYPTKILELRPLPRDRKYADFFNVFVMDMLVYLISNDFYTGSIEILTSASVESTVLTNKEALLLLYYCIHREQYETPITNLPLFYTARTPYRLKPTTPNTTFNWSGMTYPLNSFVDVTGWTTAAAYPALPLTTPDAFSIQTSNMFLTALDQIVQSRETSDLVSSTAMNYLSSCLCFQGTFDMNLSTYTTYAEWFAQRNDVYDNYIAVFEGLSDPQSSYSALAADIITALVPVTNIMDEYGNFSISDADYTQLKNLFISLCSYNVTFLDTTRDVYEFMFIEEMGVGSLKRTMTDIVPYPMPDTVDIYTKASDSMSLDIGDIEVSSETLGSGLIEIVAQEQLQISTKATNKASALADVVSLPQNCVMSQAIGVDIGDSVSVGSTT